MYYTGESSKERGFLQFTGKSVYSENNLGYIPDQVILSWEPPTHGYRGALDLYPSAMPYATYSHTIKNPYYDPPFLQYKGNGGLVVAGAVVWAMSYGTFSDDAYCKTLLPSKAQIKAALEKAQSRSDEVDVYALMRESGERLMNFKPE